MLLPDYHIHTARCGHATGKMEQYVERAVAAGLKEIGFADHIPMYWLDESQRDPELAMAMEELPRYVEEVETLRSAYRGIINIRLGIEADYIPGYEGRLRELLRQYPFDYVLGSIHYVDGWGFDNPALIHRYENCDLDKLYRDYFHLLQRAARSGLFDIMAHPDLVKKFGYRPRSNLNELYGETARVLAGAGVHIEINTAGFRAPVAEMYPCSEFLQLCQRHGVPVTVGSDAHAPDQVGYKFDMVFRLLEETGYRKITYFKARQVIQVSI